MDTLFQTPFFGKVRKAARGEGGARKAYQKSDEKAVFSTVFRVRLFLRDQGARSRGLGRKVTERQKPVPGSSRTPEPLSRTGLIGFFPRLSSQRGSRYNTPRFGELSLLALEGQEASQWKEQGL